MEGAKPKSVRDLRVRRTCRTCLCVVRAEYIDVVSRPEIMEGALSYTGRCSPHAGTWLDRIDAVSHPVGSRCNNIANGTNCGNHGGFPWLPWAVVVVVVVCVWCP